jgi:hypothetical protein
VVRAVDLAEEVELREERAAVGVAVVPGVALPGVVLLAAADETVVPVVVDLEIGGVDAACAAVELTVTVTSAPVALEQPVISAIAAPTQAARGPSRKRENWLEERAVESAVGELNA